LGVTPKYTLRRTFVNFSAYPGDKSCYAVHFVSRSALGQSGTTDFPHDRGIDFLLRDPTFS
jgi:hypothetical protein